jgi:hypothetical protein
VNRFRICGCKEPARRTGGAVSFIVRVMKRCACFLDVRSRVGSLPSLKNRGKRQKNLSDGEEKNRRSPECTWQYARMRHEGHTRRSLVVPGSAFNRGANPDSLDVTLQPLEHRAISHVFHMFRGFYHFRDASEARVIHDSAKRALPDCSFGNQLMTVAM